VTRSGAIARRYAKALFVLGQERGDAAALLAEIDQLTDLTLSSEELRRVLFTPIHPRTERRGVIGELVERLELSREVHAFSMLLVDENRTGHLPEIREALRELVERAAGRMDARLVSARPLDEREVEALREALSRRVQGRLIGGVLARVGDLMLDGSVRTQLESLAEELRKGSA
jgi:F-type H+-transporting ATPase subunit delta